MLLIMTQVRDLIIKTTSRLLIMTQVRDLIIKTTSRLLIVSQVKNVIPNPVLATHNYLYKEISILPTSWFIIMPQITSYNIAYLNLVMNLVAIIKGDSKQDIKSGFLVYTVYLPRGRIYDIFLNGLRHDLTNPMPC